MAGFFCVSSIAVAKSKIEAGALMTDPLAEREARVRAVTEANFDKVISPTHAPVKPTALRRWRCHR
jgi:hypothetical protein